MSPRLPRPVSHFVARQRARQQRLRRLEQDEATLLDRLHGTEYEGLVPPRPRTVDRSEAQRMLRFALRLSRQLFQAGAETRAIESAVIAVTASWGLDHLEVDITARSIQVQYAPPDTPPLVMMLVTGSEDSRDLQRLSALHALVRRVVVDGVQLPTAEDELSRITGAGSVWPWWTTVIGGAVLAAMLCLLASGTVTATLLAPAVLVVQNRVGWFLSRTGLPSFYVTAVQTAVVVTLSMLLIRVDVLDGAEAASLAAGNMVLLLPILSVVSLAEDAISGFRTMAAARVISVGMFLAAMVSGVVIVSALLLDTDNDVRNTAFRGLPLALTLVTAAVGALGNAVFMGGAARLLPYAVAAGVLGGLANQGAHRVLELPTPMAILIAATFLGLFGGALSPYARFPARAMIVPGIAGALLPGPDVYRSLLQYSLGVPGAGGYAVSALVSTAAIGAGTVLGRTLGAGAQRQWRRGAPQVALGPANDPSPQRA
ncbi:threonine/serine exporter family protein [Streptomyces sp. NPDC005438]|uniref:threonine/serine ThrE exporter family protein n=1 Tax=Streptomyces sp. NPDC005438 TaxID=3156880 RepID=UPI0033A64078